MFFHFSNSFQNVYLTILLSVVCVVGDKLVNYTKIHLFQAIFDNTTHGCVSGLSWFIFRINYKNFSSKQTLLEVGLATLIASLIDLDHFLAAKSFHLKDATNLQNRPILHCTTIPIVFCSIILIISYIYQIQILKLCGLLVFVAFFSHHTRDATRRGYWVYPFGSTQAIPYGFYVFFTCLIPYFVCFLHRIMKIEHINEYSNPVIIL